MIPKFEENSGNLPPGIYSVSWQEFVGRFGVTEHRRTLIKGLRLGLMSLKGAGCQHVYIDGSFVTAKETPGDFDACWDVSGVNPILLDPVLLNFDFERAAQKAKFLGEFFPATGDATGWGYPYLEFFQIDKNSGERKGIIALDLGSLI